MESLLWMLNLFSVAYLCFWALREDTKDSDKTGADSKRKKD